MFSLNTESLICGRKTIVQFTLEQAPKGINEAVLQLYQYILELDIPLEATWVYVLRTNRADYDNEIYVGKSHNLLSRLKGHRKDRYPNLELIALYGPYSPNTATQEEKHMITYFAERGACMANGGAQGKNRRQQMRL